MFTPTERPSAVNRTPQDTPTAIARTIAALACAPAETFGALINSTDEGDDRDKHFQRLVTCIGRDWPDSWSTEREIEVVDRLRASVSTDEDRTLVGELSDQGTTKTIIAQDAAFLVGVEVGRRAQVGPPEARNLQPEAESPSTTGRSVDKLLTELAACMTVPHFDDVLERHGDLYTALCDAVTPEQDRTTGADFCERCQPAYLRVDEQRNAELVARERIMFRLGLAVGRRTQAEVPAPVSATVDDTAPTRDAVAVVQPSVPDDPVPPTDDHPDVGGVMLHVKSVLRLVKSVADCELGEVAEVHHDAFYALGDLLEDTAAALEDAYDQYVTEYNAMEKAAQAGGAR